MKKRFFSVCAAIAAVCVMAFSLVGCGETPVAKPVGVNEITIESLVIDESKPFTIRPLIYSMPAEGNLVITLSDIAFTKTADAPRA